MNLKDIKGKIKNKLPIEELVIFKYNDSDFIPHQYIREYIDYTGLDFILLDSLDQLSTNSSFLLDTIYIYKTSKFDCQTDKYKKCKNLFIFCKSVDKKTEQLYTDYIIEIPKLESWQILDYINFVCPPIGKDIEHWIKALNNDMYAIENEVSKLSIFSCTKDELVAASADEKALPGCVLSAMNDEATIYYLSTYSIFDLINALFTKDKIKLKNVYNSKIEVVPVLFYQLVYNTIEDIIKIIIDPTATAEKLGIATGKYWAIKNTYKGYWTKEQLTNLLSFITSLDKMIKTGQLTFDMLLVNLIIEKILEEY